MGVDTPALWATCMCEEQVPLGILYHGERKALGREVKGHCRA